MAGPAAAILLVALTMGGCTARTSSTRPTPKPLEAVVAADAGSDVGNDRPQVTYDGPMVRRRVVIAIHATPDADLTSLRRQLGLAATRRHTTVSTISASVLDSAVLDGLQPDLVVALPADATPADAGRLMDPTSVGTGRIAEVQEYDIASLLVHDLRFRVHATHPAALSRAIAQEGILADALGNYATRLGSHDLDVIYTGPLLSDHLIESVRVGIARPAHTTPGVVTVSPRSMTGAGVDMAKEAVPAPELSPASTGHHHHAALATEYAPSHSRLYTLAGTSLIALLRLTLVLPLPHQGNVARGGGGPAACELRFRIACPVDALVVGGSLLTG